MVSAMGIRGWGQRAVATVIGFLAASNLMAPPAGASADAPAGRAVLSDALAVLVATRPGMPLAHHLSPSAAALAGAPAAATDTGPLIVEARVRDTTTATLDAVRSTGAQVIARHTGTATLTLSLAAPTDGHAARQVADLAALPVVRTLREVRRPIPTDLHQPTGLHNPTGLLTPAEAAEQQHCPSGPLVSEGDQLLGAAAARTLSGHAGEGITVGILSDSFGSAESRTATTVAEDVGQGELPGPGNRCGFLDPVTVLSEGPGLDEGRAIAQLIHDLAPHARLEFASAAYGSVAMADSIRQLAARGARVIVDDVTQLDEPFYQDGVVAAAIAQVRRAGVVYVSAVGNDQRWLGGHAVGSYETMAFRSTACPAPVAAYLERPIVCHDFSTTGADPTYDVRSAGEVTYHLGWDEPQFGVRTDLDLCLYDDLGNFACGAEDSVGLGLARETVGTTLTGPLHLVVTAPATTQTPGPRFKLIAARSDLAEVEYRRSSGTDIVGPSAYGHPVSRAAIAVGAVAATQLDQVRTYSSKGPAQVCWGPVVSTRPAERLPSCQTSTVDLVAVDGVATSFFNQPEAGTWRFYGTSAAAPHVAAAAALLLSTDPSLTPNQVLTLLRASAIPLAAGMNARGSGRLDIAAAMQTLLEAIANGQEPGGS